ncbi:3,4-dihydroxy 2-butanone 4-phosphate synthase/GTP cyclohydrolase II [Methylopila capsulata]|uniref:3,4-dihydroxy-2-butanone 4-phosphate synthase n=1 Tax=Methylopila capsulata TaxID=61654 RepID=A0A9W6IXX9_9HYPH|nr:3,4-dihydroxy-2-butanone-4-phosphate synthase [Methylopila capsulata]MBM7853451.1 3,4-dihydroxy 2-butanone 4-phosphate synthase/GTP cyclohydrolase II [Methylopila capsulata]GLK57335.1 3,4-dihydroxy-2-butanone 4-phosphate synthase [Methylopila capsulata]
MELDSIDAAVAAIAAGELVVVVDDTDRENEGDLIMAASKATPETLAFMIRHTSGIICAPMTADRADELNLAPMVANNRDPMRTAFTVSVDYKIGLTTGISAEERANTVRGLASDNAVAADFLRPGHIFPLIAREGGVLTRSGHTEAGVDLATLAGLPPVGVLAEVVNDDGTVKRLPELIAFAREHGLKIVSIEDLIDHRSRRETFVKRIDRFERRINGCDATITIYETPFEQTQHLAITVGDVGAAGATPCRIHREHLLSDLLRGAATSKGWLDNALARFGDAKRGVFVLIRDPSVLRDAADEGGPADPSEEKHMSARQRRARWREIGVGAQILRDLGVRKIGLLAGHERQFVGLAGFGIAIETTEIVDEEDAPA